jgi:hypothetical protein
MAKVSKGVELMIVLFGLFLLFSTSIADCIGIEPAFMLIYQDEYYWDALPDEFIALEGQQVEWLGYAPRDIPYYWLLERQGIQYGFAGINLDLLEPVAIIHLYDVDGITYERFTISSYGDVYFITETSLGEFGRSDGTAYDYHILANPTGGACMWLVESELDSLITINQRGHHE